MNNNESSKNDIIDIKRPTCICGSKMVLVEYQGYHDDINYWECKDINCTLIDTLKPDKIHKGNYM